MAIRLVQYAPLELQQMTDSPLVKTDRHFLLREGNLQVEVGIDRHWYSQGTPIIVSVNIRNRSSRIVKKIQVSHKVALIPSSENKYLISKLY